MLFGRAILPLMPLWERHDPIALVPSLEAHRLCREEGYVELPLREALWRFDTRDRMSATELVITADGGGSNGSRLRLWKLSLQALADETGLTISVCHFPPGTSKWNNVEHRLFSFITSNWRGQPLRDYETVVNLIARTTTAKGLTVTCRLDRRKYPTGRKIDDEEFRQVNIHRHKFHGDWNYTIRPSPK